jgi:hypothetical protein
MSNIPRAREHLRDAIHNHSGDVIYLCTAIRLALSEMKRERPKFRVDCELPPLKGDRRRTAIELRGKGWSLNRIAVALNTNIGRVSEVINGKR